jgi:tRNA (mo5U34)-methyltransferase
MNDLLAAKGIDSFATLLRAEMQALAPWWEDITVDGVSTKSVSNGAGRAKSLLFRNLFDQKLGDSWFKGKTVIDLGCNAGGSTIEMLRRGAAFVTCVEGGDLPFRQLQFVLSKHPEFQNRTKAIRSFISKKTPEQIEQDFGRHDVGFCIGLIYHMKRADVLALMRYMHRCTQRCIFSSPAVNAGRSTDWEVGYRGIDELLEEAGFRGKTVLLDAKPGEEDWSWMTNTYYFEALR